MNIFVVGSGLMGKSIAVLFAKYGYNTFIYTRNKINIVNIFNDISYSLDRYITSNKILKYEKEKILSRINIVSDLEHAKSCKVIIESIVEDKEQKKYILQILDRICDKDVIFASNTSSLSITELSMYTNRPDRFVGLHFFNPAEVMKLVEVVFTEFTSKNTIDVIKEIIINLEKEAIYIKDSRGFIVNRILMLMINEAISILYEDIANNEEIDKAMVYGANHPIGPLKLADLIGLDTCLNIMNILYGEFEDIKYKPHKYLVELVSKNMLGRKTGIGFYKYR